MLHEAVEKARRVLLVVPERAQQHEDREAALAGDAGARGEVLARLLLDVELDPLAAVGMDGARDPLVLREVAEAEPLTGLEDHARRPHELRHDDALGAVDDERALVGHHREVPHEDRLLLDLTGAAVGEPGPHEDRGRVGHVLLFALLHRELGRRAQVFVIRVELELELEVLGEVLDRADVAEGLREALVQEPLERGALDRNQIRQVEGLGEVGERITLTDSTTSGQLRLPERSRRRVPRARRDAAKERRSKGRRTATGDRTGESAQNQPESLSAVGQPRGALEG